MLHILAPCNLVNVACHGQFVHSVVRHFLSQFHVIAHAVTYLLTYLVFAVLQWRAAQEEPGLSELGREASRRRQRDRLAGRIRGSRPVQVQRRRIVHRTIRRQEEEHGANRSAPAAASVRRHDAIGALDLRISRAVRASAPVIGYMEDLCMRWSSAIYI